MASRIRQRVDVSQCNMYKGGIKLDDTVHGSHGWSASAPCAKSYMVSYTALLTSFLVLYICSIYVFTDVMLFYFMFYSRYNMIYSEL